MLKRIQYFLVYASAIVFALSGAALSAQKKPTTAAELAQYTGTDRQQLLEEGARKEGKLTLYTSQIMTQQIRPKVDAFQKKYPYIKVEIWRASTNEIFTKVAEEYTLERHVVDIMEISTQGGELLFEEKGLLLPFYSPNLAFIEEGAIRKSSGTGAFAVGLYEMSLGLGYNTKLIKKAELPKTTQNLLDPKWKNNSKIAITADTSGKSWAGTILATYGEDFVARMAKQNFTIQMVTAPALRDMIITGEYAFSPTMYDAHVAVSKKTGAPIDWIPLEPAWTLFGQITLPKYPACPNAALLYADFDLSKEAGEIYKATGYVSSRKDVPGETSYKKYYGPFSTKQVAQWNELFDRLFLKK